MQKNIEIGQSAANLLELLSMEQVQRLVSPIKIGIN